MASHRRATRRISAASGRPDRRPPPLVWLGFAILLAAIFTVSYRLSTGAPSAAGDGLPPHGTPPSTTVIPGPVTTLPSGALPAGTPATTARTSPSTQPSTAAVAHHDAARPTSVTRRAPMPSGVPTSSPTTTTTTPAVTSPSGHGTASALRATPERVPALQRFSGTLSFPNDVASSYSFNPANGVVIVSGHWPAGSGVTVSVSCRRPRAVPIGTTSVSTRFVTAGGPCRVAIAEQSFVATPIPYSLTVRYPILVTS